LITNEIVKGKSKRWIVQHFAKIWEVEEKTVETNYKETIIYLSQENEIDKEQVKVINNLRLEELIDECQTVKDKLSTIDLINKTCGVYTTDIAISNKGDETFKFDIGV
jgi:hypothetical protein